MFNIYNIFYNIIIDITKILQNNIRFTNLNIPDIRFTLHIIISKDFKPYYKL